MPPDMKFPLIFLWLTVSVLSAQTATPTASPTSTPGTTPMSGFWRAVLPGGVFRVRLDRIQSASTHEYTIEPLTRVRELTVDTGSGVVTRFYHLEIVSPQTPLGLGQSGVDLVKTKTEEAVGKVVGDGAPWKKVTKIYPATTHAHTVEYRVSSRENLEKLMSSIEKAWSANQGEEIKVD